MNKLRKFLKRKLANIFFRKKIVIPPDLSALSFTFDDVPTSAFVNGQYLLDKHDMKGTFYISLSFLEGDSINEDHFSIADLEKCIFSGHELGCHTYSHKSLDSIENAESIENELLMNGKLLKEKGMDYSFSNFSYPYGGQSIISKKITSKHFSSCRGVLKGINRDKVDLSNLKAIRLYESINPLNKIYSLLEEHKSNGGWLIFYTHDVQKDFSKYGCSPEYFESVLLKCQDLNLQVKTVNEVVKDLGVIKSQT